MLQVHIEETFAGAYSYAVVFPVVEQAKYHIGAKAVRLREVFHHAAARNGEYPPPSVPR